MVMEGKIFHAALFDLDGVVFDTESQYTVFWGGQCKLYHPDKPGLELKIKGQTLVQIFDKYFHGMENEQKLIVERLNEFERGMKFEYVKGFVEFVTELRQCNVKTAVVTSSNRMKMRAVYDSHPEFTALFDAILTSEDFAKSKPNPDCYLKAAEVFGAVPANCVVFEDSFNGLKAGRAAGMAVIGLSTTNTIEAICSYSDLVVPDFSMLKYSSVCQLIKVQA